MAQLICDYNQLREPNLMVPGKKPAGPVVLSSLGSRLLKNGWLTLFRNGPGGYHFLPSITSQTVNGSPTRNADYLYFDGSDDRIKTPVMMTGTEDFVMVVKVRPKSSTFSYYISQAKSAGGSAGSILGIYKTATDSVNAAYRTANNGATYSLVSGLGVISNQWLTILFQRLGSMLYLHCNGLTVSTSISGSDDGVSDSDDAYIASRFYSGSSNYADADFELAFTAPNQSWPIALARKLSTDPYLLLEAA